MTEKGSERGQKRDMSKKNKGGVNIKGQRREGIGREIKRYWYLNIKKGE